MVGQLPSVHSSINSQHSYCRSGSWSHGHTFPNHSRSSCVHNSAFLPTLVRFRIPLNGCSQFKLAPNKLNLARKGVARLVGYVDGLRFPRLGIASGSMPCRPASERHS
ncbi:hypothetical protein M758_3G048300 [Ceratodon purpureus]|nr:hypothetical protein M758_3G048300 [Ceratodon purpureus]